MYVKKRVAEILPRNVSNSNDNEDDDENTLHEMFNDQQLTQCCATLHNLASRSLPPDVLPCPAHLFKASSLVYPQWRGVLVHGGCPFSHYLLFLVRMMNETPVSHIIKTQNSSCILNQRLTTL